MKHRGNLSIVQILVLRCSLEVRAADEVRHRDGQPISARQWETIDISFASDTLPDQPTDVDFTARFIGESGDSLEVAGFFNGSSEYLRRFTPPSPGKWSYIHSRIGRRRRLDAFERLITVHDYAGQANFEY